MKVNSIEVHMKRPETIEDVTTTVDTPVVVANDRALIEFINNRFTEEYGWTEQDLLGQPLTTIIPEHFQDAHRVGFARFLATEKPRLLGVPMTLAVRLRDGSVTEAEHFIIGEKIGGRWRFGAIISQSKKG